MPDLWHILELNVVGKQMEMSFAAMANDSLYDIFVQRITIMAV